MADPFLLAHHVAERVFNISGKLSPVSLKDQVIRGRLFVDRAFEEGLITSAPDQGLLILGGGACGVTAAIRAAELGVPTVLLERSPRLFGLQAGCTTRWLDPAQYDWPLDHWMAATFPWAGAPMPLSWSADWAHALARWWRLGLQAAVAYFGPTMLNVEFNASISTSAPFTYPMALPVINVNYTTSGGPQTKPFGAVLVTVGFGLENTTAPSSYRGFAFWESDPFSNPNWGVPAGTAPRILISGAGDGALQDFLRIMTGQKSAQDAFQKCGIPASIAANLKDIERRAASALHWGRHAQHDHSLHMELEQEHQTQAAATLIQPGVKAKLAALLKGRPTSLKLVYKCEHLTPFYGLNRFLTLLIAEHLKQTAGVSVLEPQTSVSSVTGTTHVCAANPTLCHGETHWIVLDAWADCRATTSSGSKATERHNVLIIRHGILPSAPAFHSLTPVAQARQVLPYYLV